MLNGRVKNRSSKVLWVVVKDEGPATAYQLAPGQQSPKGVDADGFRAVDGTPVNGHMSWVKVTDLSTANVRDTGDGLDRGCLLCWDVGKDAFGKVTYDELTDWGIPLK